MVDNTIKMKYRVWLKITTKVGFLRGTNTPTPPQTSALKQSAHVEGGEATVLSVCILSLHCILSSGWEG
jgi:hypothetical protein